MTASDSMDDLYQNLLIAGGILLAGSILSVLSSKIASIILGKITRRTKSQTDDFIASSLVKIIKPFGLILSASVAWSILPFTEVMDYVVLGISKLFILIILVRFVNKICLRLIQRSSVRINDPAVSTMLKSLGPMIRAIVWGIGIMFYLQNMGIQMAAIWSLLTAGGIGAGLALKEPVQEFFEYITILLDKPFQNGQFINVNEVWATVERVGVRSTRLRSISGEIIVMSNSALTNGVISNYAEMQNRRLVHKLGVVYETSLEKMKKIPILIKTIIESTEDAIFDRCHFTGFGSSSLDFELVYFVPTNNYERAMSAQQTINLEIMRTFQDESIEFAFPTQTINVNNNLI